MELLVSGWSPLSAKLVLALWFGSENWLEIAVLSQVNHVFVVKHNKQFNSDSQRLAFSLQVEFSVYGAVFKFSVCAAHTLIGR
ncbi:hypothetical protein MUJ57_001526 [Vibrio parahaemolyticus]|nr:hypothetical protein [Vibrio parahaemolyticus]EJG2016954.1 hypothetical protein [Vibrio parahaemolyticus]EJG2030723.1 hypothetical protein [Vibrio parahaemolyticus]